MIDVDRLRAEILALRQDRTTSPRLMNLLESIVENQAELIDNLIQNAPQEEPNGETES